MNKQIQDLIARQPVGNIVWRNREQLLANDYNPNHVASTELRLIRTSILEDGWVFPILVKPIKDSMNFEIIDGFHRHQISGDPEIWKLTKGFVPTVTIHPKNFQHQQFTTIRMNRSRGDHGITEMAKIIGDMIDSGMHMDEIREHCGMSEEEIIRLVNKNGVSMRVHNKTTFSRSWHPSNTYGGKENNLGNHPKKSK